jgi:hypothetical protein
MWIRTKQVLAVGGALSVLLMPALVLAQTTTTTTTTGTDDQNTYQLAFIEVGFQIFDIFLNFLVYLMQMFMTGFFGLFIPASA